VKRVLVVNAVLGLAALAGSAGKAQLPEPPLPIDPDHVGQVGWPVWPVNEQHPIRGGFLDPRPTENGVLFHNGVDISVRDDEPEQGHPWRRTHRVYALEGGTVETASDVARRTCTSRLVRVGHFTYAHVDPVGTVEPGQVVSEGDVVGWTCKGNWHLHLTERADTAGGQVVVNPIRRHGRLRPYVDTAAPVVHSLEFRRPDPGLWLVIGDVVTSVSAAPPVDPSSLSGTVEIRSSIGDPSSFAGWFASRPYLSTAAAPYEVRETLRRPNGSVVWDRVSLRGDVFRDRGAPLAPRFAPGTVQNLPAHACLAVRRADVCQGTSWFNLGGPDGSVAWDTRGVPNGRYQLCVTALDPFGNAGSRCRPIRVAN
jgi:hypothetical protein